MGEECSDQFVDAEHRAGRCTQIAGQISTADFGAHPADIGEGSVVNGVANDGVGQRRLADAADALD
ncbi:MAG: hypothetical protein R2873_19355 [Caldilineaceae bacterium]